MMRCERCDQGERVAVLRAKMAERSGRVAVVLGVPMEECPACAERYLAWEVADRGGPFYSVPSYLATINPPPATSISPLRPDSTAESGLTGRSSCPRFP